MLAEAPVVQHDQQLRRVGHKARRLLQWVSCIRLLAEQTLMCNYPLNVLALEKLRHLRVPPRLGWLRVLVEEVRVLVDLLRVQVAAP